MGQFTRWQVSISKPVDGVSIDTEKLHDSRDDALMAIFRAIYKGREPKTMRDRAMLTSFFHTMSHYAHATYLDARWNVRSVEPVYFKESEETSG
jgi:hypothetical protein